MIEKTWRKAVLNYYLTSDDFVVIALDPDGLLIDDLILQELQKSGYEIIDYCDPFAFRAVIEPFGYSEVTGKKCIIRFTEYQKEAIPYDLLLLGNQSIRSYTLHDIFPLLSYPLLHEIESQDYETILQSLDPKNKQRLNDSQTMDLLLKAVYGIDLTKINTITDIIAALCPVHSKQQKIPNRLRVRCRESWKSQGIYDIEETGTLLFSFENFISFLQMKWSEFLSSLKRGKEFQPDLSDMRIRPYIEDFFINGDLKPMSIELTEALPDWTHYGILYDQELQNKQRYKLLLDSIEQLIASSPSTISDWKIIAQRWAELVRLNINISGTHKSEERYSTLHKNLEENFTNWLEIHFSSLKQRPYLPHPVMVHHIPHYLAHSCRESKVALIVMDGMGITEWALLKESLEDEFVISEDFVFAWIPTLTSISRSSLLSGEIPAFLSKTSQSTKDEASLWKQFWNNAGVKNPSIGYSRGHRLHKPEEIDTIVEHLNGDHYAIIINTIDDSMHRMKMGTAELHASLALWLKTGFFKKIINIFIAKGYSVFITADHGNIESIGIGVPKQGRLVEETSVRARLYEKPQFLSMARDEFAGYVMEWNPEYLGTGEYALLAKEMYAFAEKGVIRVSHGGCSIEEAIVPFISIQGRENVENNRI